MNKLIPATSLFAGAVQIRFRDYDYDYDGPKCFIYVGKSWLCTNIICGVSAAIVGLLFSLNGRLVVGDKAVGFDLSGIENG